MGGIPALRATSTALARKALITSGPADRLGHEETLKGILSISPEYRSANSSCCEPDAMFSDVPLGIDVGNGSVGLSPVAAAEVSSDPQAASPSVTAAPPRRPRKPLRSTRNCW